MEGTNGKNGFEGMKFHRKTSFKVAAILAMVFAANFFFNYQFERNSYEELEAKIAETTRKSVNGVRDIISDSIRRESERYVRTLVEKIYFEQLVLLKGRPETRDAKDARTLIDFCSKNDDYQKLFAAPDRGLTKYSYVTVSIYDGPRLVLVSHNKKSIIGTDIYEIVKKLSPEDREKQKTEKFISHWVNRESGGIYYEQTAAFKDASIPAEYNKKYSYQHWGKFNGIDIVVEYTTYIDEFTKFVGLIEKRHAGMIDLISSCAKFSFAANFERYSTFTVIISLALLLVTLAMVRRRFVEPLGEIAKGLQRFGDGRLDDPIRCDGGGEIGAMATAANAMAGKLRDTLANLAAVNEGLENTIEERTRELEASRAQLAEEKSRGEALIDNMLPKKIARRLMENPDQTIAEEFAMATVIFSDFKGFTTISESATPQKLVRELNSIFAHFDGLCEKFGVEKIKTIGDAYMAVAGAPESRETNPFDAVEMALAMRDFMTERLKDKSCLPFEIRIGIHSGPIIAGVLGKKKMVYDIWGDSVNIASRMESNGAPGKVNISHETWRLLKNRYRCEERGTIEIKGKGPMKMYFAERG